MERTTLGEEAVRLAVELVGTDSVNPGLVPGAAGEGAVVERLRRRLTGAGFTCHVVVPEGHPDRPSLLAVAPGAPDAPTVVLTGHLDTVGVDGMAEPFAARVEGDRLLGRGASDMKGGVAALVVAAEALVAGASPVRPVLALVADEEDRSLGTEAVLAALPGLGVRPLAALVAEPTWLARCTSLRGYAVVEVGFTGRAAHSSQPAEGVNAPTVDARATLVTAREAWRLDAEGPAADLAADLGAALARRSASAAGNSAAAGSAAAGSAAPDFDAPYWMEAPLWQAAGIPALVCGPAGGGLHAADEWVDLGQVRDLTDALVEALAAWGRRAH